MTTSPKKSAPPNDQGNEGSPNSDKSPDQVGVEAAELILERERRRRERKKAKAARERRKREAEQLAAVQRMQQSIEIIKWCIVGIATVMFLGLCIGIFTLVQVQREVSEIERQVDHVKERLSHPLESIGGMFGRELDSKLESLINRSND